MAEEQVRLREANRTQLRLEAINLDELIEANHAARAIWELLGKLDVSRFEEPIKAREGSAGRDATDPRILLALWLYAISEGVASARALERLCASHDAYKWICGGVSVNYHLLSEFRVEHGAALDELMAQLLGALMSNQLVTLYRVAQDGTRVRASAGTSSFHRRQTLHQHVRQARRRIEELKAEAENSALSERVKQAQHRAAREREQRLKQALAQATELAKVQTTQKNHPQRKAEKEVRASSTDPEARVMKRGDGGFRPSYNLQLATDVQSRIVVGVTVTNQGTDSQQSLPMLDDIKARTGREPKQCLLDGGYLHFGSIIKAAARGVELLVPMHKHAGYKAELYAPHPKDPPAIAQYRARMGAPETGEIYKQRAATAETVNADFKCKHNLDRFLVRGLHKTLTVSVLTALAYNLTRVIRMGWTL